MKVYSLGATISDARLSLLLVSLALLAILGIQGCAAARALKELHGEEEKAPVGFIRSRCGTTKYPTLCVSSLSAFAGTIRGSPTQLADAALNVTLTSARSTKTLVARLSAGKSGLGRQMESAFKDCMETMGDSVEELLQSLGEMAQLGKTTGKSRAKVDLVLRMDNIKTWVSAALTDDDTCMDEFAGKAMDGDVKAAVRGHVTKVARLTSNALALINGLSSTITPP